MGEEKQDHGQREPEVPETKVSLTAQPSPTRETQSQAKRAWLSCKSL